MEEYQVNEKFEAALASLDGIEELLQRMLALAQRAAADDCADAERAALQRELSALREQIDSFADNYLNAAVSGMADQISRILSIMETLRIVIREDESGI